MNIKLQRKRNNLIKGPVHLGVGQEAVAVGVGSSLLRSDRVFGAHRSHSHFLSMDDNIHGLFAEILGKVTGVSKGMGGSMHLCSPEKDFMVQSPLLQGLSH